MKLVCLLGLIVFCMCGTGCRAKSDNVLVPINVADAQQMVVGKKKLMGLAGTQEGAWVDSRSENDYRAGHIPGAINLPYEHVTAEHKKLRPYDVLVVYGNDYNDPRAIGMSKRLVELGHEDVRTLIGGMRAWKSDGNQVETSE